MEKVLQESLLGERNGINHGEPGWLAESGLPDFS
jgi:hypothetical protein